MEEAIFKDDLKVILSEKEHYCWDCGNKMTIDNSELVDEIMVYVKEKFGEDSIKNATYFKGVTNG